MQPVRPGEDGSASKSESRRATWQRQVLGTFAPLPISPVALSEEECDAQQGQEKMDRRRSRETEVYAGNRSLLQIAQELARPRGSVSTKARELKISLSYHRRRKPANSDPGPAGMDLS
jgi:hypothetical protein